MFEDLLQKTASFFHPKEENSYARVKVPLKYNPQPLIKNNNPSRPKRDITIQILQSSNMNSPKESPRRLDVQNLFPNKVKVKIPEPQKSPKDFITQMHLLHALQTLKTKQVTQITEDQKTKMNHLFQSSASGFKIQTPRTLLPTPFINQQFFQNQSNVKKQEKDSSKQDLIAKNLEKNHRADLMRQNNLSPTEKKLSLDSKFSFQRQIQKPTKQRSSKKILNGGMTLDEIVLIQQKQEKLLTSPKEAKPFSQQNSLSLSKLFQNYKGTFRMIRINTEQKLSYPKILISNYQSMQDMQEEGQNFKSNYSSQVALPYLQRQLQVSLDDSSEMRQSKTAQLSQRDQSWQNFLKRNQPLLKQESNPNLPQINFSPSEKTLKGFGSSKQNAKSFLTRRPQAKIVSRIFSSKSDKN